MDIHVFTGIVQALGTVKELFKCGVLTKLCVVCPEGFLSRVELGASIAVDGVCLTLQAVKSEEAWFDVMPETFTKTTLSCTQVGTLVNLERALRVGDELGGHILSGHIIGTGSIAHIQTLSSDHCELSIETNPDFLKYILPKGSVAIDGVSLTVVKTTGTGFEVHLIPETLKRTQLGRKQLHSLVNLEIDSQTQAIVNTVDQWLGKHYAKEQTA